MLKMWWYFSSKNNQEKGGVEGMRKIIIGKEYLPKKLTRDMIDPQLMAALDRIAEADRKANEEKSQ